MGDLVEARRIDLAINFGNNFGINFGINGALGVADPIGVEWFLQALEESDE